MPPHGDGDGLAFPPWISNPHCTQDLPNYSRLGSFSWPPLESSPRIDSSAASAEALGVEDGRRRCSTDDDADMLGVKAAATQQAAEPGRPLVRVDGVGQQLAAPFGGTGTGTTTTTGIQYPEAVLDLWNDVVARLTAPRASEDARAEEEEDIRRRLFGVFESTVWKDLSSCAPSNSCPPAVLSSSQQLIYMCMKGLEDRCCRSREKELKEAAAERDTARLSAMNAFIAEHCHYELPMGITWSIVGFTGTDGSKGRQQQAAAGKARSNSSKGSKKPHQPCWNWKERSMTGLMAMRPAAAEPSVLTSGRTTTRYVGLKKTLELDDDGDGNRWRAHEYTPLLPPHDDHSKLVPAEISLRFEYKVHEPAPSSNSKRPRPDDDAPSNGAPRISGVWEHMTKVHVKVDATDNAADGSCKKKKNPYKLMYAICNHCDKVFNADPKNGTNNQSKHLANCKCDCPQATVALGGGSHKEQENSPESYTGGPNQVQDNTGWLQDNTSWLTGWPLCHTTAHMTDHCA